jgi:hypothetical protein
MKNLIFLVAMIWVSAPAMAEDGEVLARPATQEQMGLCSETQACPAEPSAIDPSAELENCMLKLAPAEIEKEAKGHNISAEFITRGAAKAGDDLCYKYEQLVGREKAIEVFTRVRNSLLVRYLGI